MVEVVMVLVAEFRQIPLAYPPRLSAKLLDSKRTAQKWGPSAKELSPSSVMILSILSTSHSRTITTYWTLEYSEPRVER